jgi:amino acid permease
MSSEITIEAPATGTSTTNTNSTSLSTPTGSVISRDGDCPSISFVDNNENDAMQNGNSDEDLTDNEDSAVDVRIGTISSARFNILSTMVGGGCLSLPLAFQQSGNALMGPLVLLITALITDFCFRLLVSSSGYLHPPDPRRPGKDTFESITSVAFGAKAYVFSMGLVVLMCFFGAVGYSVLLRDMMEPLNDTVAPHHLSHWFHKNFTMFLVILLVTPFCTLRHLTALKDCGAASMTSVLILGSCIVFRSVECNLNSDDGVPWYKYLTFFPDSWRELLDALPLFISCFVCHYNILPVFGELKDPSPTRVSWWLRSTLMFSSTIYVIIGFAGSAYAKCTPDKKIHGNILLDFDKNDPLLMVGRMCLAVTITLAFPMLVIPARDIMLRSLILPTIKSRSDDILPISDMDGTTLNRPNLEDLQTPLLQAENIESTTSGETAERTRDDNNPPEATIATAPFFVLLTSSMVIFWSAGALASFVSSIDIVWDLLGSSLSILLSYIIPAGTYLVITKMQEDIEQQPRPHFARQYWSRILCWVLLWIFFPLMIISTTNAVINTFLKDQNSPNYVSPDIAITWLRFGWILDF